HHWITAQEFGERFGIAKSDLDAVTSWLHSHGFTVHGVYPNLAIDFSGTAGQVRSAFHPQLHELVVNGERHFGNAADPQIPEALAPLVAGISSLHDFMPRSLAHRARRTSGPVPEFSAGAGYLEVVPEDLATIYNLKSAFAAGITGKGQTIAVLENSDLYSPGDWYVYRKVLGLARKYPNASLTTVHPSSLGGLPCFDPGVNGNDAEVAVDVEAATAAAPDATIEIASCADTVNFGGFIALQNLLTAGTPPAIISLSYGMPEMFLGAATNEFISSLYQMAVAEGVSIFVGSGDSGAAMADAGSFAASYGISVNGYASTPYNVAVGATDYADTYLRTTNSYWSPANTPAFGSALSYIPEIPWNTSCGSELLAKSHGFHLSYGPEGFCNSAGGANFLSTFASGGGPSGCARGEPTPFGTVGNTCAGYSKPAWQKITGNPKDGVRDLPDISLFGSNGTWAHYFVVCFSDPYDPNGASCLGDPSNWAGFGGTSVSAPIAAGIQALVNQATRSRWGNPNPVYYELASAEYGATGSSSCNSSKGAAAASACAFYDISLGDIDVDCTGPFNCDYGPDSSFFGVLSTSSGSFKPAYASGAGWDFATGIGSINAWNLIKKWPPGEGAAVLTTKR
ncbi:MAG: hypothetical protein JO270_10450, partial [Acidobacteriaceae bacterium]|nr:hypothetical protein [Acidobacteriaceae bacterium]